MAGEKNNRQRAASFLKRSLKVKTVASHHDVKHEAARRIWIILIKKFFRRREGSDSESIRAQQTRERLAHRRLIIHHKYGLAREISHLWLGNCFFRVTSYWQAKVKGCAAIRIIGDPDIASVRLNDGAAHRKAQSHSFGLGREERFEHLLHFFFRNAASTIADRYTHCAI